MTEPTLYEINKLAELATLILHWHDTQFTVPNGDIWAPVYSYDFSNLVVVAYAPELESFNLLQIVCREYNLYLADQ